jgi:hypothetical protein
MWNKIKVWYHRSRIEGLHNEIGHLQYKIAELEFDVKRHRKSLDGLKPEIDINKYIIGVDPVK